MNTVGGSFDKYQGAYRTGADDQGQFLELSLYKNIRKTIDWEGQRDDDKIGKANSSYKVKSTR